MKSIIPLLQSLISFVLFLTIGYLSLIILKANTSLQNLMQIFYILAIVIGISFKTILPKLSKENKHYFFIIASLPVVAFIYLLVFSTGILFSPYLVLTHFFAIATSFLLSPQISIAFVISTTMLITGNALAEGSIQSIITKNTFLGILIGISYAGLIPLSYILAKEYKLKEEWARILEQQIATSKTQEEELLKSINEIVIVIDNNFRILYLNKTASKTFNYKSEAIHKNIYKLFKFKNSEGLDLYSYSLPFVQIIKSGQPQTIRGLQIKGNKDQFASFDMKIIPALEKGQTIGLILIMQDISQQKNIALKQIQTSSLALSKFLQHLSLQKKSIQDINSNSNKSTSSTKLLEQNHTLEQMAEDLIYIMRIESGDTGTISNIFDIGLLIDKLILEENHTQNKNGVLLYPIIPSNKKGLLMPPQKKIQLQFLKRNFPDIYIVGNENIIKQSLKRILSLLYLTSYNRSSISVQVTKIKEIATISFISHENILTSPKANNLFEKYYGNLADTKELSTGSGLEGYIAKTLLERTGAHIKTSTNTNNKSLTVSISFGVHNK